MGVLAIGVIIGAGFFVLNWYIYYAKQGTGKVMAAKNATYVIEGTPVTLVNGTAEQEAAPGSASKIVTQYFGNDVSTDLDGDGRLDTVFLLTQSTGGSGTFYYVVAALNTEEGYKGSQALLLGDRIAPQSTSVGENGTVVVNYAERAPGESFATPPSIARSVIFKLDPATMQFGEVVGIEGEADPSHMSLSMKEWVWVTWLHRTEEITPNKPGAFTITFDGAGKFSTKTDCNSMGGTYTSGDGTLSFGPIMSTKMYCEGSQESVFSGMLEAVEGYHFTPKGELVLELKDGSTGVFK